MSEHETISLTLDIEKFMHDKNDVLAMLNGLAKGVMYEYALSGHEKEIINEIASMAYGFKAMEIKTLKAREALGNFTVNLDYDKIVDLAPPKLSDEEKYLF